MRINNNVKRLLKLIGTLLPNYKFIQVSEKYIEIYYIFKDKHIRTLHVGTFVISTMEVPEANSYTIYIMNNLIPIKGKILKDWEGIGLTCEVYKDRPGDYYNAFYKIGGYT